MASFLVRSHLGRASLKINLSNWNGLSQDANSVKYTIFAANGSQVSGTKLPAIRQAVGTYYIPWITDVPNGSYRVDWEVQEEFGGPVQTFQDFFFVVDPANYQCGSLIGDNAVPKAGWFTFLSGQSLGLGDLPLYLKNDSGFLQDAYAVFWTVFDSVGRCVSPRTIASQSATGTYFASWTVNVCSGNYQIKWEFQKDVDSPLESASVGFSVVNPCNPYAILTIAESCGSQSYSCHTTSLVIPASVSINQCSPCGPVSSYGFYSPTIACAPVVSGGSSSCCVPVPSYTTLVSRTTHIEYGILPAIGAFTNQDAYSIPSGINRITFFITYARGDVDGYATFRVLWGNGTEEVQESIIDNSFSVIGPTASQDIFLQELDGPAPVDSNPISFTLAFTVPGGATTVRLLAAEKGAIGFSGTLGATLTGSSSI